MQMLVAIEWGGR